MTSIEAGAIGGGAAGAMVGGFVCKSLPAIVLAGGSFASLILGALAGVGYALVLIFSISVVGVLWRAVRNRDQAPPTEVEMGRMTPVLVRGTLFGIGLATVGWFAGGWIFSSLAAFLVAMIASFVALGRGQVNNGN